LVVLINDQVLTSASLSLNALPLSVLQGLGLDAEKLQSRIPGAEAFSDISMPFA
jgi:hypothetical protein